MKMNRLMLVLGFWILGQGPMRAQRTYAPSSVLATGRWYQLATRAPGIYRIDVALLNSLGVSGGLPSATLRLYGNGGAMLPESNAVNRPDDLQEIPLEILDGGDGIFNGSDQAFFYAPGPDEWVPDPVNRRFLHRKNLYSDRSFFFLTVGGNGQRVPAVPLQSGPSLTVTTYSARYFHENDTVNFLSSGKEWFGEEFSALPGRSLSRSMAIPFADRIPGAAVDIRLDAAARSVGAPCRWDVRIGAQPGGTLPLNGVGSGTYDLFAQQGQQLFSAVPPSGSLTLDLTFAPGGVNAQGWLNWFEAFTRCSLTIPAGGQRAFRDWASVGQGRVAFELEGAASGIRVWEITDPLRPRSLQGDLNAGRFRFINEADRLREYIAFQPSSALPAEPLGSLPNQDLHAATPADLLIITHPSLRSEADRLARLHRQRDGLSVTVVTTQQVFNEFSSGSPDPVAMRDFVKMYYDRFSASGNGPEHLLLFGDASFDYKDRLRDNTSLVPCYQSTASLDPLSTYVSDDFFGFLDDQEDINSGSVTNLLDIGIGRIPARTAAEAAQAVTKIERYYDPASLGPWRNQLCFVADDEDGNLHLQDAELLTATAATRIPNNTIQKIYLDAYRQESGPGGGSYPQAVQASNNALSNGTLIWNYSGHGGPRRLAEETVLDAGMAADWNNGTRLPLFITATCDFAPYDDPLTASIGEDILLRSASGAIALMTTTRPVFAFSNRVMNDNYLRAALERGPDGRYPSLGGALQHSKNVTYQSLGDIVNNRKFTLLGDPALTLAFPKWNVRATRINGLPAGAVDTLRATEMAEIEGEVTDIQGNLLPDFNGTVYPSVYDKPRTLRTLGNDPGSPPVSYETQDNLLFRGPSTVLNGRFRFRFRVPRDINYRVGNGKLSFYADNGSIDAAGSFTGLLIGGAGSEGAADREGPRLQAYLNDDRFVTGGITNETPWLLVKLSDSSGINTTGTGIGHDIVATLDRDNRQFFILNDYFQAERDSYQRGTVRFRLPRLEPGPHQLHIKAWDVLNNSGDVQLDFTVASDGALELSHVLNYPNPFHDRTRFWFEHNRPGQPLQVQLEVLTLTGRVIRTIRQTVQTEGNRSDDLEWDGRDQYGDRPGRGVYLYRLRVTAPDGKKQQVLEKLVLL
jgi:hypothetical protein